MATFNEVIADLVALAGGARALSRAAKVSDSTIRKYLLTEGDPTHTSLKKFAKNLGLTMRQVLGIDPISAEWRDKFRRGGSAERIACADAIDLLKAGGLTPYQLSLVHALVASTEKKAS